MADCCSFLTLRRCASGALGARHCWILRAGGISFEFIFRLIDEREDFLGSLAQVYAVLCQNGAAARAREELLADLVFEVGNLA